MPVYFNPQDKSFKQRKKAVKRFTQCAHFRTIGENSDEVAKMCFSCSKNVSGQKLRKSCVI